MPDHAAFCALALTDAQHTWQWMQRFSRVSNQVGKAIVLCSAVGGEYANTAVEFVTIWAPQLHREMMHLEKLERMKLWKALRWFRRFGVVEFMFGLAIAQNVLLLVIYMGRAPPLRPVAVPLAHAPKPRGHAPPPSRIPQTRAERRLTPACGAPDPAHRVFRRA